MNKKFRESVDKLRVLLEPFPHIIGIKNPLLCTVSFFNIKQFTMYRSSKVTTTLFHFIYFFGSKRLDELKVRRT